MADSNEHTERNEANYFLKPTGQISYLTRNIRKNYFLGQTAKHCASALLYS